MWIIDLNRFVSGRWGSSNDKLAVAGVDVATEIKTGARTRKMDSVNYCYRLVHRF